MPSSASNINRTHLDAASAQHHSHLGLSARPQPPTSQCQSHNGNGRVPKQRRNKPTLSCAECVERKTKCDRLRPTCLACVRRQSSCRYSQVAENLAAAESPEPQKSRRPVDGDQSSQSSAVHIKSSSSPQDSYGSLDLHSDRPQTIPKRRNSIFEREAPGRFDSFGMNSQHPFHNYWTRTGGLSEVVGVLPSKTHADVLVDKYFEVIDPLYPIIARAEFVIEYELFWSLSLEDKCKYDAAKLALQFVVYAMGTQYMHILELEKRIETAEFYISASHQALSVSSYLNRFTISTLQTMVLTCYFLVSNNHISDAWTFSGIIQRQASALGLNRDPDIAAPEASFEERQQRCKLWQAIMFQDTGLALYLKLPPTSLHYDLTPDQLKYPTESPKPAVREHPSFGTILNAYVPQEPSPVNDVAYVRSMWEYASFVGTHVCIPKALNRRLFKDQEMKTRLIAQYREMHQSWPFPFSSNDPGRYSISDQRLARQLITVSSSYFYVLMDLYADEDEDTGVICDIYGTLEATHQGLTAFFALAQLFPGEVDVWLAYHTRAYVKSTMIANILAAQIKPPGNSPPDPRLVSAKKDLDRFLSILTHAQGTHDYEILQRTRASNLFAIRNTITAV